MFFIFRFGEGGEEMSDEITQQTLLPEVKDPNLWMVKCRIGRLWRYEYGQIVLLSFYLLLLCPLGWCFHLKLKWYFIDYIGNLRKFSGKSNIYYFHQYEFWLLQYFLVAKLLYKSKCPSVCQPRLGGNVIFPAPNWDIAPIFFVQIPFINEHLFCKYFVSLFVCLSGLGGNVIFSAPNWDIAPNLCRFPCRWESIL